MTIMKRIDRAGIILGEKLLCNVCLVKSMCVHVTGDLVPFGEPACEIRDKWFKKFWDLCHKGLI